MLGTSLRQFIFWRMERQTVRRLEALDDHLLADIGTDRRGIERFVRTYTRR